MNNANKEQQGGVDKETEKKSEEFFSKFFRSDEDKEDPVDFGFQKKGGQGWVGFFTVWRYPSNLSVDIAEDEYIFVFVSYNRRYVSENKVPINFYVKRVKGGGSPDRHRYVFTGRSAINHPLDIEDYSENVDESDIVYDIQEESITVRGYPKKRVLKGKEFKDLLEILKDTHLVTTKVSGLKNGIRYRWIPSAALSMRKVWVWLLVRFSKLLPLLIGSRYKISSKIPKESPLTDDLVHWFYKDGREDKLDGKSWGIGDADLTSAFNTSSPVDIENTSKQDSVVGAFLISPLVHFLLSIIVLLGVIILWVIFPEVVSNLALLFQVLFVPLFVVIYLSVGHFITWASFKFYEKIAPYRVDYDSLQQVDLFNSLEARSYITKQYFKLRRVAPTHIQLQIKSEVGCKEKLFYIFRGLWRLFLSILPLLPSYFVARGIISLRYDPSLYLYEGISLNISHVIVTELLITFIIMFGLYPLYAKVVPYGYRGRVFIFLGFAVLVFLNYVVNSVLELLHHIKYFLITNSWSLSFIVWGILLFSLLLYLEKKYAK